jgi:phosphatidylglycerophosphate synthase
MFSTVKQVSDSPQVSNSSPEPPVAILNACRSGAWEKVGGIPLIARTLYHLKEFETKEVVLLLSMDSLPTELEKWQGNFKLQQIKIKEDIPTTILSIANLQQHFLYIDAAHLIDPRLIQKLTTASESILLHIDPQDREKQAIRAGFFTVENLHLWAENGDTFMIHHLGSLFPGDIDLFNPETRGPLIPYFIEIGSRDDARKATRILVRSSQKKVGDLPAEFIDPSFENALTLLFCDTPITPDMITLSGWAVAIIVAYLFWHGWFLSGALLAFVVEILDGVDGKLARTTLHYSKLGHYEHVTDYFYENSWYVAIAVGLSVTIPNRLPALLAGLLILSDTADNIFYALAGKWYGKSIDLFSPFDAAFRRIAGRRNIYVFMFIIGFLLGYRLQIFAVAAIWAAVTATIHGVRLIQYGRDRKFK